MKKKPFCVSTQNHYWMLLYASYCHGCIPMFIWSLAFLLQWRLCNLLHCFCLHYFLLHDCFWRWSGNLFLWVLIKTIINTSISHTQLIMLTQISHCQSYNLKLPQRIKHTYELYSAWSWAAVNSQLSPMNMWRMNQSFMAKCTKWEIVVKLLLLVTFPGLYPWFMQEKYW